MIWVEWLLDEKHRALLAFLGVALAAVVRAGWAYYTRKHPKPKDEQSATPPTQTATANHGAAAINVSGENNQIHIRK